MGALGPYWLHYFDAGQVNLGVGPVAGWHFGQGLCGFLGYSREWHWDGNQILLSDALWA